MNRKPLGNIFWNVRKGDQGKSLIVEKHALEYFLTDRFKYHIVKQIFSGGDQTFVLCSKYEVKFSFDYYLGGGIMVSQYLF